MISEFARPLRKTAIFTPPAPVALLGNYLQSFQYINTRTLFSPDLGATGGPSG